MEKKLKYGDKVFISADSAELGLKDYNVRVSTFATIEEDQEYTNQKDILVTLEEIDGDRNVLIHIPISSLQTQESELLL